MRTFVKNGFIIIYKAVVISYLDCEALSMIKVTKAFSNKNWKLVSITLHGQQRQP